MKAWHEMQVSWISSDLSLGLGHGIEVQLELGERWGETLGFIDGYSWFKDKDPNVIVYLDQHLKEFPSALTSELRLAILLFIKDKKR
jgi:hypothetical protein